MDRLISEKKVLDVINEAIRTGRFYCGKERTIEEIKAIPSAEPKIGRWIYMGDRYIKCSECGHITKTESPDIYHFCMVCGANMSENPTGSKPEISSYYGLKSYVRERSEE